MLGPAVVLLLATAVDLEFFEKQIRPLLSQHCFACHSSSVKAAFAGLRLDSKAEALKVIVPGKPSESKLLRAVRGELKVRMPPTGPLPQEQIDAIARWIEMGAPWPDEKAPPAAASAFDLEARKREHWAWQPVRATTPPEVRDARWPLQPVDRFILAKLEQKGLRPAAPAGKLTLLRRVFFDVTGLPPTPDDIAAFEKDTAPDAYERLVDRLLDSPAYGERMARRWMDLLRYSESHGSEGDPDVPAAWRYRDYLIRAFNTDVPYDQLIREHLAGDLLPQPRYNRREQLNESLLGLAHFRMVEHGFQPVDPWEDRVKWMDNQIDVISKAFQGITISCARCHDHKFDAISQKDFYALFGILYGARPTQVAVDTPEVLDRHRGELARLKGEIRRQLAARWRGESDHLFAQKLEARLVEQVHNDRESPLYPVVTLSDARAARDWAEGWRAELAARREFNAKNFRKVWDLTSQEYDAWLRQGVGAPEKPSAAGEFTIEPEGARIVNGIYPAGVYTGLLSRKHGAVITSPRFKIETGYISFRMLGGNFSSAQLIVENYAVPRGGIYNLRHIATRDQMGWLQWDTTFWKGFTGYIEFATKDDVTLSTAEEEAKRTKTTVAKDGRSWLGVSQIVFHDSKVMPKEEEPAVAAVLDCPGEMYAGCLQTRLGAGVETWSRGALTNAQAALLDYFVRNQLLSNSTEKFPDLVTEYRRLEQEIAVPRRAPGILQEPAADHPLLVRGSHKDFGELVSRRYLAALGSRPLPDRLRLAEEIASPRNPLTARVLVNRLWQYVFRRGIVRTADNLGKLGDQPTHPELLDWLAGRFVEDGWSIKKTLRLLLTSQTYRMSSVAPPEARKVDAANDLFHHLPLRRLEAEELRDAILAVSGRLDRKMYGESVRVYYAHDTGKTKGDRPKGPLDGDGRRSVYLEIRRNATHPFLEVFDAYKPTTTRGRRDVTNVPAQSLALMNGAFVTGQSEKCANLLGGEPDPVGPLYLRALGRRPESGERDRAQTYAAENGLGSLVLAVFNMKEFLYVP